MHRNKKLTCLQVSVKNWNNGCHVRKVSGGLDVKQRELYVQSEKYKVDELVQRITSCTFVFVEPNIEKL